MYDQRKLQAMPHVQSMYTFIYPAICLTYNGHRMTCLTLTGKENTSHTKYTYRSLYMRKIALIF